MTMVIQGILNFTNGQQRGVFPQAVILLNLSSTWFETMLFTLSFFKILTPADLCTVRVAGTCPWASACFVFWDVTSAVSFPFPRADSWRKKHPTSSVSCYCSAHTRSHMRKLSLLQMQQKTGLTPQHAGAFAERGVSKRIIPCAMTVIFSL